MQNKEKAVSSEELNGTYSRIVSTSTRVRVETSTPTSLSFVGPDFPGVVTLHWTERSPNNPIIVTTIDASCARKLGTELITLANQTHLPLKLKLTLELSKTFNRSILKPFLAIIGGTTGQESK